MNSRLAATITGLAAVVVLVGAASAGGSTADLRLGRIAVVSEFYSTETYVADRNGKNQHRLTNNPLGSRWPTISPDGSRLAFSRKHAGGWSLYVTKVSGGPLFDVTKASGHFGDGLSGYSDFSPDGTKIAWSQGLLDGSAQLLVYDFELGTTLDLTHNDSVSLRPRWSPDGTRIVYASNGLVGDLDVYVINADGTGETRLTSEPGWDIEPTWSPDGGRLAYTSYPLGVADVFVMNADGSGVVDVTNDPKADDYQPSWSSAGITFSSLRGGHQVYVIQPNGRGRTQVTSGSGGLDPRWAPGGRIVFSSSQHARSEIGVVKGSTYRPLTRGPWFDSDPAWSRDGKRLAFVRSARPGKSDILVAGANGKGPHNLTRGRGLNWGPTWSPRANTIAFVRFESFGAQIWAMRPDGTGAHALTSTGSWNESPSWSADGRRLVFSATRNGNTDLYVLDLQTGRERRLTRTPESELDPAWSPNGKSIAFSALSDDGAMAIFTVQPDGRYREKVTEDTNNKTNPSWSPDSTHVLYQHEHFLGHDFDTLYIGVVGGPRSEGYATQLPWSEHSPAWQPRS